MNLSPFLLGAFCAIGKHLTSNHDAILLYIFSYGKLNIVLSPAKTGMAQPKMGING